MNYSNLIVNYPILQKIGHTADQLGLEVCVVGGFVRDLFLERPCSDIDIVCVGNGIEFAEAVAKSLDNDIKVNVFKNFGTAMLRWQDYEIEFVGARKESYNRDSRNPIVTQGTLADDQRRRDFTINTLAIRLNKPQWGELVDELGGITDLKNKVIKTPLDPGITFSDDPLRMLRAIRFASQFHFAIDLNTLAAIKEHAERIKIISQERITDELNKIILSSTPSKGFKLLFDTGLLQIFFPVLTNLQGRETIGGHTHKDNFYHTLQVLDNIAQSSTNLWLRWAGILHDIAKPLTKKFSPEIGFSFHGHEDLGARMVPKIFKHLKLPLQENMLYVQKLVRLHLRPIVLAQAVVTDSAVRRLIYEAGEAIHDLMLLCRADITSNNPIRVKEYLENFDKVEQKIQEVEEQDQIRNLQPVITGDIIIQTFQIKPSHVIGEIKAAIKEAILEGEIRNEYQEAFQYMLRLGMERGLTPTFSYHQPVMLQESLQGLAIQPDGIYVDATFGGGGHSRAILAYLQKGRLFAFDQDEDAAAIASTFHHPSFTFIKANARFLQRFLAYHQIDKIDGLIADLGVSSHQIDTADRGFSTRLEGPLDMRMAQASSLTASQIVNTYSFEKLTHLFREYGELHQAPALAKAILTAREKQPIETTQALREMLLPFVLPRKSAKFLAQVFQALRIEVNDELGALKSLLEQSIQLLKPGGRLVVISYHSLEDRLAKRYIKTGNLEGELQKDFYGNPLQTMVPITKKAVVPAEAELAVNPRARSAKLRVGERTSLFKLHDKNF